jgi:hypothetical protein
MDTALFRHCADDEKVVPGYLFLHVDNVICRLVCARARRYRRLGSKKVEQDWADLGRGLTLLVETCFIIRGREVDLRWILSTLSCAFWQDEGCIIRLVSMYRRSDNSTLQA